MIQRGAYDASIESREHPDDDFYKGKKLAYQEVLNTIKNELIMGIEEYDKRETNKTLQFTKFF